jgi:hypothetical protein
MREKRGRDGIGIGVVVEVAVEVVEADVVVVVGAAVVVESRGGLPGGYSENSEFKL